MKRACVCYIFQVLSLSIFKYYFPNMYLLFLIFCVLYLCEKFNSFFVLGQCDGIVEMSTAEQFLLSRLSKWPVSLKVVIKHHCSVFAQTLVDIDMSKHIKSSDINVGFICNALCNNKCKQINTQRIQNLFLAQSIFNKMQILILEKFC